MQVDGSCHCGSIEYRAEIDPERVIVCHCTDCQKQAGTAFSEVGISRRDGLQVTGELQTFSHPGSSGQMVNRKFCGRCGSPILTDTAAAREQGIVFIKAGTLDKADDLAPTVHFWTQSAHQWFTLPDGVTCLEQQ